MTRRKSGRRTGSWKGAASPLGKIGAGIFCLWRWALRMAVWCLRMAWNVCWVMFALFCGGFGLLFLFGLGTLTVLWMQHYPLAGVTIGCLGLVLCMFSAAGFAVTLLLRGKGKRKPAGLEGGQNA